MPQENTKTVDYAYDSADNLVKVTGRKGETTTYEYDALNRPTALHLPDGISTYKRYNARDQVEELTTSCDDCGWILGHYLYTYDDRGYLIAEHTEEAREADPYGRQPHTPYKPEKQGKNCDHGKNRTLSYYLLVQDKAYTYDDAGKLLTATETQAGCGTTSWRYAYDLMGNRILEEKKNPGGKVVENNRYAYNDSNQLVEATLCNGRTTRKVCYTYDADGNLIKEYSPTDNGQTSYQYTVENRLEAVYTGNAYNRTLQMAAAYDGDGNRVYQVNYNPDKDEDFSCYYRTYNSCDYNGTGIQLKAAGEVSPTEEDLISLIAPAGATLTSKYELIEYVNDVNREYVEVLVEQNINGRTDTTYTYGVDRISKELFNQESRMSYYLYDPRGSVAGLADAKGHLAKTYQYSPTGELPHGAAAHENEYTYNGESYNPNIQSQYLRARYYSVVTANFLTEDTYLGSINEPLTLNRYNYCISSYPNYEDPSGNSHNEYHPQAEMMEYMYWLTGDEKYSEQAEELYGQQIEMEYYEASTSAGVVDSVLAAAANTVIFTYNVVAMGTNLTQSLFARELGSEYGDRRYEYPVPLIPWDAADNYLENNASKVWNMESYHIGRCGGDVLVTVGSLAVGTYGVYNGLKNVSAGIRFGSNGGKLFALVNSQAAGGTLGLMTSGTKALNVVGTALANAVAYDALTDFRDRVSRISGDKRAWSDSDVIRRKFSQLLNSDYYKTHIGYDCSEIAQDFYDTAGQKGKIYRIEGKNGYINGYEYNYQTEYLYHEVYSDGTYIYDPRYKNVPVLKDDYFRELREINPEGFTVFEITK